MPLPKPEARAMPLRNRASGRLDEKTCCGTHPDHQPTPAWIAAIYPDDVLRAEPQDYPIVCWGALFEQQFRLVSISED